MWKVSSKNTMIVGRNPHANFPLSIELVFDSSKEGCGMWMDVSDAEYLVRELKAVIAKQKAAEHRVQWTLRLQAFWKKFVVLGLRH